MISKIAPDPMMQIELPDKDAEAEVYYHEHSSDDIARACAVSGALELLEALLPEAAKDVELASCDLTDRFKSLASSATAQSEMVRALIVAIGSIDVNDRKITLEEFILLFGNTLDDAIAKLLFISKKAVSMVYSMEEAIKNLQEIQVFSKQIQDITKKTKMLALNASIEACKAGEVGLGFAVVADEVKAISTQVAELSQAMTIRSNTIMKSVQVSYEVLQQVATTDLNSSLEAKDTLQAMMHGLSMQNKRTLDVMQNSANTSHEIAESIRSMVVNLQFQDRNTQLIENAVRIVKKCLSLFSFCHRTDKRDTLLIQRMTDSILSVITLGEIRNRYAIKMRDDNFLPDISIVMPRAKNDSIDLF